ncbi:Chromosome partitioning ATPase, Mrp family, contains Fe-S cluster [Acetitomaculum ruminis DSM 5522]|uniref:Iron-sulfur cluster carrier protein n=1 Tax=Acetitomaculum ruminis DSM 5522 TaxID=1120918 RepID=A0A1I0W6L7_9FIRM|nr:Mrp/NBP35 family ATP-binding protein [Acetitomaculum ruminis]SFA83910.1 Chromosome partitioning ATPase, Mrp family, contains Fe-S cluster [Acetitomaculum ruminis DSM 5522]
MSEECTPQACSTCKETCSDRKADPKSFLKDPHPKSRVNKVIAIVSGKGGVGKSLVTSMMAVNFQRLGKRVAVLDADITGPSIPKMFGIKKQAEGSEEGLLPVKSSMGTQVMSVNLLLEDETKPVIWRGPVIAGTVTQFWTDVIWEDVDYMFVDMPPGTGDVPLTVFQSLPVDGIIIVTSPQDLVSMVVQKAVNMAEMMNIPILGIVENMSYIECPDCHKKINVFGESHIDEAAKEHGLTVLDRLPLNPKIASACDKGMIELADIEIIDNAVKAVEDLK